MTTITIKEIKELINNKKTLDNKLKLKCKTDTVKMIDNFSGKDFSYFDILMTNKKKETYFCCVHVTDLQKEDSYELNIIKWN